MPVFLFLSLVTPFLVGCDFGAAQDALESTGVIVELPPIETTVSGKLVDAATGELVKGTVTLRFKGGDGDAVIDMYSDPITSQTVTGAVTSFGIANHRQPSPQNPVQLRIVADAQGYQTTSEVIDIYSTGTTQFTLSMLSEDPTQQPDGASGVRDNSGKTSNEGKVKADLNVRTPSENGQGQTALHIPEESVLRSDRGSVEGRLTVDLSHYQPSDATLDAVPGNGTVQTGTTTERFAVAGYMNLQIRDANGDEVSSIDDGDTPREHSKIRIRLPQKKSHPSKSRALKKGDELELFRYDSESGTWTQKTTLTVRSLNGKNATMTEHTRGPGVSESTSSESDNLGLQWSLGTADDTGWWAWGTRSKASCNVNAEVSLDPNNQTGNVEVTLQRSGLKYESTHPVDEVAGSPQSLSALVGQSTVPQHEDYELTLTTRDGQSRTLDNVNPCGGTHSVTLPAPATVSRTDVLFRAYPKCPAGQKVRVTSMPTLTIYYRESDAPEGATWHKAGSEKITWIMDDPDNPTYVKRAELRLDGLKQDTRYDMFTTYDGDRYEASGLVPDRDKATIEEGRVVVEYSQDFSDVCS